MPLSDHECEKCGHLPYLHLDNTRGCKVGQEDYSLALARMQAPDPSVKRCSCTGYKRKKILNAV